MKQDERYREAYETDMRLWRGWYGDSSLVDKVRTHVRERDWKRAARSMLALLRYHPRGLALPNERPEEQHKLAQELRNRERQLEQLKSRLAKERREVRRLEKQRGLRLPVGEVSLGNLRRLEPISRKFGFDRGQPVDRYYVENFFARHAEDVRGRVLEIGHDSYTRQYGGGRVEHSDVLQVAEGNPQATIVADLTRADHVPSDAFDCVILAQTLHLIYDTRSAIRTLHRILKPGGVLLATFPGISQIEQGYRWGDWYWAFTTQSARRLFEETFPAPNVEVEAHGNVLAAISFLHGLAVEELSQEELDYHDPAYEVLIATRAVKPEATL